MAGAQTARVRADISNKLHKLTRAKLPLTVNDCTPLTTVMLAADALEPTRLLHYAAWLHKEADEIVRQCARESNKAWERWVDAHTVDGASAAH
eukprot:5698730-Karenia_brevis.AAC.1